MDSEVIKWLVGGFIALTAALEAFTNTMKPWSWLLKKIGNIANQEMIDQVTQMRSKLDNHIKDDKEDRALEYRARILSFAGESRRGIQHTEEEFDRVIDDIDRYQTYCRENPDFPNNKAEISMAYIKSKYEECLLNNSFL